MSTVTRSLRAWAVQDVVEDRRTRAGMGVLAFVVATSLGAQIAVPLPWTSVLMTLQPLFVILAGALLGPRLGAAAMTTYLMVGAAGAPVFSAGGGGLPWLLGPTGGYLLAMPAAAAIVGVIVQRSNSTALAALGLGAGVLTMYVGGVSQLLIITGSSFEVVLAVGVLPFLAGDLTKVLIALAVVRVARPAGMGDGS